VSGAFTPGPWFAVPIQLRWHGARPPIFEDGLWHIHEEADPEKCEIAVIDRGDDHDPPTRKRAEANARLIAAAPELYEALEDLAERMMGAFPSLKDTPEAQRANAALAKVRGEQ
jgi:hypothetical protein